MAYIALNVVYVVAALAALVGIWLVAHSFVSVEDNDGTGTTSSSSGRWAARRGPILIAVGVSMGLIGNISANHLPVPPASDMVTPSSATDMCDNNDGLFGLCGAGQLHR